MAYSNDDIKKWLDEAIKKIQESKNTDPKNPEPSDLAVRTGHDPDMGSSDPFDVAEGWESNTNQLASEVLSAQDEPDSSLPAAAAPGESAAPGANQTEPQALITIQKSSPTVSNVPAVSPASEISVSPPSTALQRPAPAGSSLPAVRRKTGEGQLSKPAAPRKNGSAEPKGSATQNAAYGKGKTRSYDVSPEGVIKELADDNKEYDTGPADFNIKFDFDTAYRDIPEERPLRFRREKRTGCVGGLLYSVFVICISLILASLAWMAASDILGFATADEQVSVTVQKGFSIEDIVDTLYDAGLIKYKFLFKIYADYSNAEKKIAAGSYILNKNFDYRALVYGMTTRNRILTETTVTIPEGFTLAEIFIRLEDHGVCPAVDLWETARNYDFNYSFLAKSSKGERLRLEGFMFPETYNFYLESSPVQVIAKFLDEFDRRYTDTYTERAEAMGYSVRDIITVASMIEREAGSDEERPRIAAVIYNRLNNSENFPFLQIDATLYYAAAGTSRQPSTDIDSPYNTYLHEGLPPGPIANPGMESIRAALYPDSTDEFYYALNKQGTHEFFRTLAQHEAFVDSDNYGGR